MQRVHIFRIATKKAEKKERDQKKKDDNPFENKEHAKVKVEKKLMYADTQSDTFQCTMRYARREECSTREEHEALKKIVNFRSTI